MFSIREATPSDNEALLRLEADSPQGTGISILIDRADYFYRSRVHNQARVLLAVEDGLIVGVMAFAVKDVLLNGVPDRAAYFYDLRGEATYRRSMKRGLFRLWKTVFGRCRPPMPRSSTATSSATTLTRSTSRLAWARRKWHRSTS